MRSWRRIERLHFGGVFLLYPVAFPLRVLPLLLLMWKRQQAGLVVVAAAEPSLPSLKTVCVGAREVVKTLLLRSTRALMLIAGPLLMMLGPGLLWGKWTMQDRGWLWAWSGRIGRRVSHRCEQSMEDRW